MPKPYSDSRWRNHAAPIIAKVLAEHKDSDAATLRKALKDAYPFGPRKYHPYKIWCSEVKRQLEGQVVIVDPQDTRRPIFGSKENPFGDSIINAATLL